MFWKKFRNSQKDIIKIKKVKTKQSRVIAGYLHGMDIRRFLSEVFIPVAITAAIVSMYFIFVSGNESVSERITKINSSISTVVAIQVGFNITCLALIASFGKDTVNNTFSYASEATKKSSMNQIVSSYIYGIIVYLTILILGFLHLALIEPLSQTGLLRQMKTFYLSIFKVSYFSIWSFLVLHGLSVFLRNAKLIQLFLLVNVKNSGEK